MKRPLALIFGSVLALAVAEGFVRGAALDLRLLTPLVPVQVFEPTVHQALPDPELLYGLRPGLSLVLPSACPWSEDERRVHTNALGLRDPERAEPKPAGTLRVLAAGSSNTFGPCVSDEETWPARLEGELAGRLSRPVEVWNLGISGYMTRQAATLALRTARAHDADLVLLQVYNEGRRFAYVDQPVGELMATDERLWSEYLAYAPTPDAVGFGLFRRSGLYRLAVVALNRVMWGRPGWDPLPSLLERARAEDAAAFRALSEEFPVVVLVPPVGAEAPEGARVIDLSARSGGADPQWREIHPGPAVYNNVAKIIADELIHGGVVYQ